MKVKSKGDERKSAVTKTFSWLAGCLLQICGQVNNYACAALRALLKQGNGDFAGVGVLTDVIKQLLQQPIEGEAYRFALRRGGEPVVKAAADTALGKGKLIEQMVQRLFKRQLIEGRRAQLAQQLAGRVVNASGEIVNLAGGGLSLRRIARPLYQLRLDLNGGNILADFIVQLARQAFARILSSRWR